MNVGIAAGSKKGGEQRCGKRGKLKEKALVS